MNEDYAERPVRSWTEHAGRDMREVLSTVESIRTACDDVLNRLTKRDYYGARQESTAVVDAATQFAAAVHRLVTDMTVADVVSTVAGLPRTQYEAAAESIAAQAVHAVQGEVD